MEAHRMRLGSMVRIAVQWTLVFTLLVSGARMFAQSDDADGGAEDDARQKQIAARFQTVLEKNPRRGAAFDKVYGHHVEFGTLDDFLAELKARTEKDPEDGVAWMLLGMVESNRGEDAKAAEAFLQAGNRRPNDPIAPFYHGQSLVMIGETQAAADAYEQAIDRQPDRADVLEIFQQLGRLHQRAQRDEEALKTWNRLEELFPNDPRVLEQIAAALADEGSLQPALERYERLVGAIRDDYQKTVVRIEVAQLKSRLARRDEGLADLESLLGELNPDGWLYRDVRRRIDDLFLHAGDQDGLVGYYEEWLKKNPQDVDAMARLSKHLTAAARVPEASQWLEKAIKLAPTRGELRKAFIDQLVGHQNYDEAVRQYSLLSASSPGNPDILREWGKLVLRNTAQPEEQRQQEASRIWNEIRSARPDDALTASQVADLFRHAHLNEQALELYRRAVELAPNDPQYREYLGEFYHIQKDSENALQTWKQIAAGDRRNAVNLSRMAEVLQTFGCRDDAVAAIAEAAGLDPKDLSLQIRAANYHNLNEKFDEALRFIDAAQMIVDDEEEHELVLSERVAILTAAQRLNDEIDTFSSALSEKKDASAREWLTLARYYESTRELENALNSVDKALALEPESIAALTYAARLSEAAGDLKRAAEQFRRLAQVDRRSRGDHLMRVAQIEANSGRTEEALAAARELIISSPGNTEHRQFYAQLCFQLNRPEEGLDALRKAVRINPSEPQLILSLAQALASRLRTDEAIELYWRAFEQTDDVEDLTTLVVPLTDLYLELGKFDQLIDRLERKRTDEEDKQALTIALAQAHHSSGDYGAARQELESLLRQETRDTVLLQQLSKLCEAGQELESAIDYQRRLCAVAPAPDTDARLAHLLKLNGQNDEATEILVGLTRREEDPVRLLKNLDSILSNDGFQAVLTVTESLLRERRDDWELLYREGVAWAGLGKSAEAVSTFQRLLDVSLPHSTKSLERLEAEKQAKSREKWNGAKRTAGQFAAQQVFVDKFTFQRILGSSHEVQQAVNPYRDAYSYIVSGQSNRGRSWSPACFGVARMAAIAWLLTLSDSNGETDGFADRMQRALKDDQATREQLYDLAYLESVRGTRNMEQNTVLMDIANRLARLKEIDDQQFYLSMLQQRHQIAANQRLSGQQGGEQLAPLSDEDLELMMQCYRALAERPETTNSGGYPRNYIIVNGTAIPIDGAVNHNFGQIYFELRLAGRTEEAEELWQSVLGNAKTTSQLIHAIALQMEAKNEDEVTVLFERWRDAANQERLTNPGSAAPMTSSANLSPLMRALSLITQRIDALAQQDRYDDLQAFLEMAVKQGVLDAKVRQTPKQRNRPSSGNSRSGYAAIWKNGRLQHTPLPYSEANRYMDDALLGLLRQANASYESKDLLSDLEASLRQQADSAPSDERIYRQLLLGYFLVWQQRTDEGVEEIASASEYVGDDPEFKLQLALLRTQAEQFDDALEILESMAPRDQKLLQQRETLALNVASRLGDVDRARAAVERLAGLRLSSDEQLGLIPHMQRLGMHEFQAAILNRINRRAENKTSSLSMLMSQYQSQGNSDMASQVAHRILQMTKSGTGGRARRNMPQTIEMQNATDARNQALQYLVRQGTLSKLIERTEEQLARSPNSLPLYEQLIEYYSASNQKDKLEEVYDRALQKRPDSVELRLQIASEMTAANQHAKACDHYLFILERRPELLVSQFYVVNQCFSQANRQTDLANALIKSDLKAFASQPYYLQNVISNLLNRPDSQELGISLLERALEKLPQRVHSQLFQVHSSSPLWQSDRMYELVLNLMIPNPKLALLSPWGSLETGASYGNGGRISLPMHNILQVAKSKSREDLLRTRIDEALAAHPGWHSGTVMRALLDLQTGKKESGREALEAMSQNKQICDSMPYLVAWMIGQELDQFPASRETAIALLEQAHRTSNIHGLSLEYSPIIRLVNLYHGSGNREAARKLIHSVRKPADEAYYDQSYRVYQTLQNDISCAGEFVKIGCPIDAIRIYNELIASSDRLNEAQRYTGRTGDAWLKEVVSRRDLALASLNGNLSAELSADLLTPTQDGIDLMLTIPKRVASTGSGMQCLLEDLLIEIGRHGPSQTQIDARLDELKAESPENLSVALLVALWNLKTNEAESGAAVTRLLEVARQHSLEPIAPGVRINTRQRKAGAAAIPLWIAARKCLAIPRFQAAAVELGERALDGAGRQSDINATAAILLEWGQWELKNGNRQAAEKRWRQLLDVALTRPAQEKPPETSATRRAQAQGILAAFGPSSADGSRLPLAQVEAPNKKSDNPASEKVLRIPPVTLDQFSLAILIAEEAAKHGMFSLSQDAVRESLAGGFPVPALANVSGLDPSQASQMLTLGSRNQGGQIMGDGDRSEDLNQVGAALRNVVAKWDPHQCDAGEVYQLLEDLTFPADQPQAIRLYEDSSQILQAKTASLGATLTEWAQRAGKAEQLRARIAERTSTPYGKTAGLVLECRLAMLLNEQERVAAAIQQLETLLKDNPQSQLAALAAQSVVPAFLAKSTKAVSRQALMQIAASHRIAIQGSQWGMLHALLAEDAIQNGRHEDAQKLYHDEMEAAQAEAARNSGDYSVYQMRHSLATLANDAARNGSIEIPTDFLGRLADLPPSPYGSQDSATAFILLACHANKLPADERYDFWKNWTLPPSQQHQVRFLAAEAATFQIPDAFLAASPRITRQDLDDINANQLINNFTLLIDAAEQAGKLDELERQLQSEVQAKTTNADAFYAMVLLRQGDIDQALPIVTEMFKTRAERLPQQQGRIPPTGWSDYLVWKECLRQPETVSLAIADYPRYLRFAVRRMQTVLKGSLGETMSEHLLEKHVTQETKPSSLLHWVTDSENHSVNAGSSTGTSERWGVVDGALVRPPASAGDTLFFKYPLEGNFEFSAELAQGLLSECNLGFAGTRISPHAWFSNKAVVTSSSGRDSVNLPEGPERTEPDSNRIHVRMTDGVLVFLVNGHPIYEEPCGAGSPWLELISAHGSKSIFRDLRLIGEPRIPREVRLIQGETLDGWGTSYYQENQPGKRSLEQLKLRSGDRSAQAALALQAGESQGMYSFRTSHVPSEYDWSIKDGVLVGRRRPPPVTEDVGWATYLRPLQSGESISYEFFYVPDEIETHPTIGKMALVLAPSGVRTRWLMDKLYEKSAFKLPFESVLDEPQYRKGADSLPLQVQAWNTVRLTLSDNSILAELNGTEIFERPLDPENDRRFGLFHAHQLEARVRNVVLTGPWPESIDEELRDNLLATDAPNPPAYRQAMSFATSDLLPIQTLRETLARARAAGEDQAFEILRNWVLPGQDHLNIRLESSRAPVHPAGPYQGTGTTFPDGERLIPAMDLLRVAKRLGRLDELESIVTDYEPAAWYDDRNQQAMLAAIKVFQGDPAGAMPYVESLLQKVRDAGPNTEMREHRGAEYLFLTVALSEPALHDSAHGLVEQLISMIKDAKESSISWSRDLAELKGRLDLAIQTGELLDEAPPLSLKQWRPIPMVNSRSRSHGGVPTRWSLEAGRLAQHPSEIGAPLVFQSPLEGTFEIVAEQPLAITEVVAVAYGVTSAGILGPQRENIGISHPQGDSLLWEPRFSTGPSQQGTVAYRIAVDQQSVKTYVNDDLIHEKSRDASVPWVSLYEFMPFSHASLNSLKIVGNPVVPEEIRLLDTRDGIGWKSYYFDQPFSRKDDQEQGLWHLDNGVLSGKKLEEVNIRDVQSLIYYHRPLLEDGEVEFEMYYVPGSEEVSPAIGRSVFLLSPQGAKRHIITDAQDETSRFTPDNESPLDGEANSLPLKENAWNHVKIRVQGDAATLFVNDAEGGRITLTEPPEIRYFGLFRYADTHQCRVKDVVYRGAWPQKVPDVANQELASPGKGGQAPEFNQDD